MGCAAGCILYLIRGMWLSPKSERLYGGIMLLKKRAPILGGIYLVNIQAVLVYGLAFSPFPTAP